MTATSRKIQPLHRIPGDSRSPRKKGTSVSSSHEEERERSDLKPPGEEYQQFHFGMLFWFLIVAVVICVGAWLLSHQLY